MLLAALVGGSAITSRRLARRYRLDRDAAYARLAAIDRTTVVTSSPCGTRAASST